MTEHKNTPAPNLDLEGTYLHLANAISAVVRVTAVVGANDELDAADLALAHVVARRNVERAGGREVEARIEKFISQVKADAIQR